MMLREGRRGCSGVGLRVRGVLLTFTLPLLLLFVLCALHAVRDIVG